MNRRRTLIWDLPTRIFHWLLASSFAGAFAIALLVDDESTLFNWHMFFGGVVVFAVLWRTVWGLIGSRWARFGSLRLRPGDLFAYLGDVFRGKARRYAGHNPASSAISVLLLLFGLAMPLSALLMSTYGEAMAEAHEVLAWGFAAAVAIHVTGVLVYTFQHDDSIAMSMIDGRKTVDEDQAIESSHTTAGIVLVVLTALWSWGLVANFDAETRQLTVPVIGSTLQIGEDEHGEDEHERNGEDAEGEHENANH